MDIENQKEEKLVERVKRHWIYLAMPFALYLMGWALALTFVSISDAILTEWGGWSRLFIMLAFLTVLASHHWFFFYLLSREASLVVITDKQILNFEYLPLIRKDLGVAVVGNIDEIEEKQEGLLQNILHYGTVIIRTSAGPLPIRLRYIPHPTTFIRKIRALNKK